MGRGTAKAPGHSNLPLTLLLALGLVLGLRGAAALLTPANPGMVDQPCPPEDTGLLHRAGLVVRVLAGDRPYLDDWQDICIHDAENRARIASGQATSVVFLGDSQTARWKEFDGQLFSGDIVGRGVGGQTSGQLLGRFQSDVVALKPKVVHIMAGSNDLLGLGGPSSPELFKGNIRAMVDIARANGIAVILASVPPMEASHAGRVRELNGWLARYAADNKLVYVDYARLLSGPDGTLKPELTDDTVHLTAPAYAAMAPLARAAIAQANKAADVPLE